MSSAALYIKNVNNAACVRPWTPMRTYDNRILWIYWSQTLYYLCGFSYYCLFCWHATSHAYGRCVLQMGTIFRKHVFEAIACVQFVDFNTFVKLCRI
jgi:hypothetical protein